MISDLPTDFLSKKPLGLKPQHYGIVVLALVGRFYATARWCFPDLLEPGLRARKLFDDENLQVQVVFQPRES